MTHPSPEELAESLVKAGPKQPRHPWFIELRELLPEPVFIGPYQNPNIAEKDAKRIKEYLAKLIRNTAQEWQP